MSSGRDWKGLENRQESVGQRKGKGIPEQLMQRLDMCKNTAGCTGVSHSAGL